MKVVGVVAVCLLLGTGCTSTRLMNLRLRLTRHALRTRIADPFSHARIRSRPADQAPHHLQGGDRRSGQRLRKGTIQRAYEYFEVPHPGKPEMRYAEVYGKGSPYASEDQLCGRRTDAGGIQIYLEACSDLGRTGLVTTIVHEVFHAMQDFTRDTYRRGPDIVIGGLYPNWYEEGSAVWAAARVLDEWNIRGYGEASSFYSDRARDVPETLRNWRLQPVAEGRRVRPLLHGVPGGGAGPGREGVENRTRGLRTRLVTSGPPLGQGFQGDVRDLDEAFLQGVRRYQASDFTR